MGVSPEQQAMLRAHGAPYPSTVASVGGMPTPNIDVPILSVLIVLYFCSAAGNMAVFQLNRRNMHHFLPNALLFGFSMARILTCSLRIGLAYHPKNVSLAIAANIFLAAGILIVYIVNLIFSQRIIRAKQPRIGWSAPLRILFALLYALVAIFLVLIIVFTVYQSYTLKPHWHAVTRNVQLGASTYFIILSAAPLLFVALSFLLPRSPAEQQIGKRGSTATKALIVSVSALLCLLGAGFKAGATWPAPRPVQGPAWYQSRACLYVFYFGLEILILAWYLAARIDQHLWVPNGSSKPKSYALEDSASSGQSVPEGGVMEREMESQSPMQMPMAARSDEEASVSSEERKSERKDSEV